MDDIVPPSGPWYHGSPLELAELAVGSTISPSAEVARVFSHRPTMVSFEDDGRLRHNGVEPGWLYEVEGVGPDDVEPVPGSTIPPGVEWLVRRPLRLRLLGPTSIREEERLPEGFSPPP